MNSVPLGNLLDPGSCAAAIEDSWKQIQQLYPICRSITGNGVRATLKEISERIPLKMFEVPSGRRIFDWVVPREWNIREAWIKDPDGKRIVDLRDHSLHVVSYSTPVRRKMSLSELRHHLHSIPAQPDWIPYRTSYYRDNWGFCLADNVLRALPDGDYEVCIDSTLENGSLTYAECFLPGSSSEEFLVFTHICHPSLCNDNLTGIAIATQLAHHLKDSPRRLSYRFVFGPGTIGSIAWLAENENRLGNIACGLVIGLLGDAGPLTFKRSRDGDSLIDRVAQYCLPRLSPEASFKDFSPYGYDERQLCSPGFNLPVGRLTRSPNDAYPQYHTSADDFSVISKSQLTASLAACASILRTADQNLTFVNLNPKCEPMLGKRGLYRVTGGSSPGEFEHALLWVLNQSDGSKSLLDVAIRSGIDFQVIADAGNALLKAGLLAPVTKEGSPHAPA